MRGHKTMSMIYQNFFERNNTPRDMQNHLTLSMTDDCLSLIKDKTSTILKLIAPLNYPLPDFLLSKIDVKGSEDPIDPSLDFELKLFNWFQSILHSPMDPEFLTDLQSVEGLNELNLSVPENFVGFLTYGTIVDEWGVKDLRLNRTLDVLLKDWESNDILSTLNIKVKNEFLTLKNGLLIVSKIS